MFFAGEHVREAIKVETPKRITNVESCLAGSVKELCESAANTAKKSWLPSTCAYYNA